MPSNLAFDPITAWPVPAHVVEGLVPANDPALPTQPVAAQRRRPKLLIRAARAGQAGWRRERDLRRVLGTAELPGRAVALRLLEAEEAHLNEARRARAAEYAVERHVLVLIALLAELRAAVHGAGEDEASAAVDSIVALSARGTARRGRP